MLAGAAYPAMLALGMLKPSDAHAFDLPGSGNGKKVIILGGGLAGMTCAYELTKLGYNCTILEARKRAGGRCFSIRNGSTNTDLLYITAKNWVCLYRFIITLMRGLTILQRARAPYPTKKCVPARCIAICAVT
jgi:monoamine oxidase